MVKVQKKKETNLYINMKCRLSSLSIRESRYNRLTRTFSNIMDYEESVLKKLLEAYAKKQCRQIACLLKRLGFLT